VLLCLFYANASLAIAEETYREFIIQEIEQKNENTLEISAETDLPTGMEFFVAAEKYRMKPNDVYVGTVSERAKIENGKIRATIVMKSYDGKYLPEGNYVITFYSGSQWYYRKNEIHKDTPEEKNVYEKIGKFGENIQIPKISKKKKMWGKTFIIVKTASAKFYYPMKEEHGETMREKIKEYEGEKRKLLGILNELGSLYNELLEENKKRRAKPFTYKMDWASRWNKKINTLKNDHLNERAVDYKGYYGREYMLLSIASGDLFNIWNDSATNKQLNMNSDSIKYFKEGIEAAREGLNE